MSPTETTPVLADAADVLSDQLHGHLQRLVSLLAPHAGRLETRFLGTLQKLRFDVKQRSALAAITLGAAARLLATGHPLLKYFEQVEYNGRRLAKLNLPPSAIAKQ